MTMRRMLLLFLTAALLSALYGCAGNGVDVRPKGQMVIGGSVGNTR